MLYLDLDPGFKFLICHLLAMGLWANRFTILWLGHPICKLKTVIVPLLGHHKDEMRSSLQSAWYRGQYVKDTPET